MSGGRDSCVTESELAQIASGDPVDSALALHTAECDRCKARVADAQADAAFLTRVKRLRGSGSRATGLPLLNGYRILHEISAGAQGVVYRAIQESTARPVAIKVLQTGDGTTTHQRLRAQREAEIAAKLTHPNIVTVYESRNLPDGRIAIVMEFVDGVPFDQWLPVGESPSAQQRRLLEVFVEVAQAVHHAHLNGVIHRDLKPDNILITGSQRPVVLDFGVARFGKASTTATGEFAGTPAYASPEQVSGEPEKVDALTDVYSLGVLLYRLLCGGMPYDLDGSLFDIARTIQECEPIPPREKAPGLHRDLDAIVRRALEKHKHRRYQSAASLARDLQRHLSGDPVDARSGSGWYLMRKAISANRARLVQFSIGASLLFAGAGVVGISLYRQHQAEQVAAVRLREANAEHVRAQAVSELLHETFPAAGPARAEIEQSVGAGLSRLYYRLETGEFASRPELDLAVRRLWSSVYTRLDAPGSESLVAYAEVALRNGLVKLRQQHPGLHPDIASGTHELAGLLLVRMRLAEAKILADEAIRMRSALHGSESIPSADSYLLMARILVEQGDTQRGLEYADHAERILREKASETDGLSLGRLLLLRARIEMSRDEYAQAEETLKEGMSMLSTRLPHDAPELLDGMRYFADLAVKREDSPWIADLAEVWGAQIESFAHALRSDIQQIRMHSYGNPVQTTGLSAVLQRSIRFQESILGRDDPALVRTLLALMHAARIEGEPDVHAMAAVRAASILTQQPGYGEQTAVVCLEEAAAVLAGAGQPARAVELALQAQTIRQSVPVHAQDTLVEANARRNLAFFMTLDRRYAEAIPLWESVSIELRDAYGSGHHVAALADSGRAFCLAALGDVDRARILARNAYEVLMNTPSAADDQLASAGFVDAHLMVGSGEYAAALEQFESIWPQSFALYHPGYAWRQQLLADAIRASEALGDQQRATMWLQRATAGQADATER